MQGNGAYVSWCLGHILEYMGPDAYDEKYKQWKIEDLPIVPENWKLGVMSDKKKQFSVLKKLLNDKNIDYVVNACDAGREGELIFRRVYEASGCTKPIRRLWISSMEDSAIREGFRNLRNGREYENLKDAAVCRAQADWLVGMNGTRAYSATYRSAVRLGRVQTPTLAMLVARDEEIRNFQKKQFFMAHILHASGLDAATERIDDRGEADRIAAACNGKTATVKELKSEAKSAAAPKLYDLTTLQRDANRLFGISAADTLSVAQALYEAKLLTYPRTDSRYLTDDMEDTIRKVTDMIQKKMPFIPACNGQRNYTCLLNSKKVSDHHAIIPTLELAKTDIGGLDEKQKRILMLVCVRVMCASAPKHLYTANRAVLVCEGYEFTMTGKEITQEGWKRIDSVLKKYSKKDDADAEQDDAEDGKPWPNMKEGDVFSPVSTKVSEHWTSPPKPYTEDSLLSAMERAGSKEMDDDVERKGLGTPATRASIIEKLIKSGYAERKKRQILPTPAGIQIVALVPDYVKSATMTADWENRLLQMERGQENKDTFMHDICNLINQIVDGCKNGDAGTVAAISASLNQKEVIGSCPICGKDVINSPKTYRCEDRDCTFALWKDNKFLGSMDKKLTKKMAADLVENGSTFVKGLHSQKTGKTFDATLHMTIDNEGKPKFSLSFDKPAKKISFGKRTGGYRHH